MENQLTIILSVISALFGGGFVAVVNYINNKRNLDSQAAMRDASVKKLEAEADRICAETDRIRGNVEQVKSGQKKAGKDIELQARQIGWIKVLIRSLISDYERMHLKNLLSEQPFLTEVKKVVASRFAHVVCFHSKRFPWRVPPAHQIACLMR